MCVVVIGKEEFELDLGFGVGVTVGITYCAMTP